MLTNMKIARMIVLLASAMSASATMTINMGGTMERHSSYVDTLDGDNCGAKETANACVRKSSAEDKSCIDACVVTDETSLCDWVENCFKACISEETAENCEDEIYAAETCHGCKDTDEYADADEDICSDKDHDVGECLADNNMWEADHDYDTCISHCSYREHAANDLDLDSCTDLCLIINTCIGECLPDGICKDESYKSSNCHLDQQFGEGVCNCAAEETSIKTFALNLSRTLRKNLRA